jgi:hypothetical protein
VDWITDEDVALFLGIELSEEGDAYLTQVTAAAQVWAYERRLAAGYSDDPEEVPNERVKLGTMLLAGSLYREQGSIDSFASFQDQPLVAPVGTMGQINKMLGIPRFVIA